ncbi:MmcQ/YjbR family DNA-binding protein [Lacinutrix sp. C3R15]|uniref:MmcQ/YjbR family DNA-binding protein n=1 Tax=Flavobacteriaceae TaxID=49546 RepID=UPI001C0A46B2|nr:MULTISPECIES: MmcQ/YjbR family DNA-binding protein [Flavobacteriaceae]MBU2939092.1 MmcQ/YjbR family DNA-binding protein [Lacinutrix sp. C3R15]MDO6622407.1 MmcQ/YjbR family DNA-binding protein [Oceanihabitans sp. 1_MG-2023]
MDIEQLREYCLHKKGVTEHFPFDENTLVFKVLGKMYALTSLKNWESGTPSINLKCNPDYAQELRATYKSIAPGYHMNKKHWNTVQLYQRDLSSKFIFQLIDHSYDLVVRGLTKKQRDSLI